MKPGRAAAPVPAVPADQIPTALATAIQQVGDHYDREQPATATETGLLRAVVPLATPVSPVDWLANMPADLRFYGATRDPAAGLKIAGIGEAAVEMWPAQAAPPTNTSPEQNGRWYAKVFDRLQARLAASSDGVRFYGGFRFAPQQAADVNWQPFGRARFIVPRFELVCAPHETWLALHFSPAEYQSGQARAIAQAFDPDTLRPHSWQAPLPAPVGRYEIPDYSRWEQGVATALDAFDAHRLDKVVLARKACFTFQQQLDPIHLLHRLLNATPDCFHFCFMPSPDLAFVGASPERLYRRRGQELLTEAIAGTRMRHVDPARDAALGAELQSHEKDQREHEWVRQGIREALTPLSATVQLDPEPTILKLARGQHLYSGCSATLKPQVGDAELMAALHPTAALGGYPTGPAGDCIAALETFDRGWYAGPVGWLARDQAEFAVAIRAGLVQPRKLSLFSGAGIVAGSTPEAEWDEIELKIRDFIKVLTTE